RITITSKSGGTGNAVLRVLGGTASKMSHIRPLVAWAVGSDRRFGADFALFTSACCGSSRSRRGLLRQGRRAGRGAYVVVSALAAALALMSAATAQQRTNQPHQPQPQRQRGADPVPGGFQNEAVDLNEGKSPAELFKSGCAVCHNSAAGLAKGRSDSQLVG